MNIDGVVRELPLFSPEIDPGLLVKAAAAGVDIASALADLQAPLPLYRFNVMAQKASELCAEVKSLGAALLSAIEKSDAEALARLRSGHEMDLLRVVRLVKETQLQEAKTNLDALGDQPAVGADAVRALRRARVAARAAVDPDGPGGRADARAARPRRRWKRSRQRPPSRKP